MKSIDTKWFVAKIEEKHGSIRQLAPKIIGRNGKIDQSSLVRMLNGDRAMSLFEAKQLSDLLGVSLEEIAKHALSYRKR